MRWIGRFIASLWHLSRRSWVDVGMGLRPGSRASALVLFLFLIFLIIGGLLMLLGFDLADVDRWIDAQTGWLDLVGTLLFNALLAVILLVCALMVLVGLAQGLIGLVAPETRERRRPRPDGDADIAEDDGNIGCLATGIAAVVGWFAYAGLFG